MTYLVDANVLCEPTRLAPAASAVDWLRRHESDLVIDPIILGEIEYGILRLPKGKKRNGLERWFEEGIARIVCLPWDSATGRRWARLLADLRRAGQEMPMKDSLVAATALIHGLTVATRNLADFRKAGVDLVDPFAA